MRRIKKKLKNVKIVINGLILICVTATLWPLICILQMQFLFEYCCIYRIDPDKKFLL